MTICDVKFFLREVLLTKKTEYTVIHLVSYLRLFNYTLEFSFEMCFRSQFICLKLYAVCEKL